jgi:hypothetical protein
MSTTLMRCDSMSQTLVQLTLVYRSVKSSATKQLGKMLRDEQIHKGFTSGFSIPSKKTLTYSDIVGTPSTHDCQRKG